MTGAARRAAAPVVLAGSALALWELLVRALDVPGYLFPAPSGIAGAFGRDAELLARNGWVTLREILLGVALALLGGFALGLLLHLSEALRRSALPLLVASQAFPPVVLAPVLVVALGFGLAPKLAIVGLVCFFPITVATVDGLRSVDPELRRTMRTLHASRSALLRRVEVPWALPRILTGTRVAVAYAGISAVFGEWSGASAGLGYVIQQATATLDTERIFAAVAILAAISLALFGAVSLLERVLVPWARHEPAA